MDNNVSVRPKKCAAGGGQRILRKKSWCHSGRVHKRGDRSTGQLGGEHKNVTHEICRQPVVDTKKQ